MYSSPTTWSALSDLYSGVPEPVLAFDFSAHVTAFRHAVLCFRHVENRALRCGTLLRGDFSDSRTPVLCVILFFAERPRTAQGKTSYNGRRVFKAP